MLDQPIVCNCACQRCLDGGCCMVPTTPREWPTQTYTSSGTYTFGTTTLCDREGHNFSESMTPGRLYCRKCGDWRDRDVARKA